MRPVWRWPLGRSHVRPDRPGPIGNAQRRGDCGAGSRPGDREVPFESL